MRRLTVENMHALAREKGLVFLDTEYHGNKFKHRWKCSVGHEFLSRSNGIVSGDLCHKCAVARRVVLRRIPMEELHSLAAKYGGKCLDAETYKNCSTKLQWQCAKGHVFLSSQNLINCGGSWCPHTGCSKAPHKTMEDLHIAAKKREGECLSVAYKNAASKYTWKCQYDHVWNSPWTNIQSGNWCPTCAKKNDYAETELRKYVKGLVSDTVGPVKGILKTEPRLELDIWIPSMKVAIELDGESWHARPDTAARDKRKNIACEREGIRLLRIPYRVFSKKTKIAHGLVREHLGGPYAPPL